MIDLREGEIIKEVKGFEGRFYITNHGRTTKKGNAMHAVNHGLLDMKGSKHHNAKLTKIDVTLMRGLYATGNYTHKQIGSMFGVCRRQSGDVINGVNWGWLQ